MDLIIRNINPSIVKKFDEKAKNLNLSRQVYLKNMLENHTIMNDINEREMEFKHTLNKNTEMLFFVGEQMEKNTEILQQLLEDDL
ncbi:hypothetical protein QNH47_13235 [Virgibacillus halodenitrificans]|uniref:hypothetical protein n=1 Tax=Virgibacillus halodenitrificans TaxID=1482 RepID=UPI0024BF4411|nr:hypothetical protein [Virgibacillus halodenitrificans]WHX25131.1 hypothetical protein QNH47_13235 [Virgibacillus halodenitrificans]